MTASTAPTLEQVAPNIKTRVADGDLGGAQTVMLGIGAIALIASLIGWGEQFIHSYLVAYMFTLSLVLGAMFFVMVQHITRAGWSVVVRRIAENMMGVMPVMAVLFLPILFEAETLFSHWWHAGDHADPTDPMHDPIVHHKIGYLNPTFFYIRVALYFAIWLGLARYFRNASIAQDQSGDPEVSLRLARRAAPGLALFALSLTFAAFDWMMSIDPHWFSTMFGVTYFAGSVMSFYATLALTCLWLRKKGYLGEVINREHYHDIGKLLFAFMVFWTYVNFSQYMLIFYANLPEETLWYQARAEGGWATIGTVLIIGHFLVPFAFLMSRHIKRNTLTLSIASIFLLAMHWLDMQFLIMPNFTKGLGHPGLSTDWLDFTTMIGMLALFVGLMLRNIANSPLVPERDPRLGESLKFHNI